MSRRVLFGFGITAMLLVSFGCGGTWVDDKGNFNRVFGFDKPKEIQVLHSYYWKSPHWTTEYRYYIELRGPANFAGGSTDPRVERPDTSTLDVTNICGERPSWFLPKPFNKYNVFKPVASGSSHLFEDKEDGTIYACDELL